MKYRLRNLSCLLAALTGTSLFAMTEADDACIDALRVVGGGNGQSGTIESSQFSEAGTLVMLRDAGGTLWRCIAYQDGKIGEMSMVETTDDGDRAMDGAGSDAKSRRVKFDTGTTGAELAGSLVPGATQQYILDAQSEQFLYVRVAPVNGALDYIIRNPDGSELLSLTTADREYRGQLWQSGDHVIEIVNRGSSSANYNVIFGVE